MSIELFSMEYPFADAPDTLCFTCTHICNDNKPVLFISHDEDGVWQFLCGNTHSVEEARIVSLYEMVSIRREVRKFAHLKCGEYAEAIGSTGKWSVGKK